MLKSLVKFLLQKQKIKRSYPSAFSLVELSIVLLIIGILIAATISAKTLFVNSRVSAAQAKTMSSPIHSIPNVTTWLESSLDASFNSDETDDGAELSGWNDVKSNSSQNVNNAGNSGTNKPTNSNEAINYIQAVKFDSSDDTYFNIDGSNLNGSDYTILVLEKRKGSGANYFFGDSSNTTENQTILLGYSASNKLIHSHGGTNSYTSSVDTYSSTNEKPSIFVFIQNSSTGKKSYINGYLAGEDSDTSKLSNIGDLKLGKGYDGEIGEFLIFNRALKKEERQSIEKYLQEKWGLDTNSVSENSESCLTGTVTGSGCTPSCTVSITGSSDTSLPEGDSTKFTCDVTGYTGSTSINYECSDGALSPSTPAISQCVDDNNCASGYSDLDENGTCEQDCTITGESGIVDGTTVQSGSISLNCNDPGATGGSIIYTCSNGTPNVTNNSCVTLPGCSGGDNTSVIGGDTIHIFTSTGSAPLVCSDSVTAQILVVAGGGSGGSNGYSSPSGGGGGGGVVYSSSYSLTPQTYSITVGNGGAAVQGSSAVGASGGYSEFETLKAYGGGGGGQAGGIGLNGGSGGGTGAASPGSATQDAQINGTAYYGHDGGAFNPSCGSSGGGGATETGQSASGPEGGDGVDYSSITGSESPIYYGGGGSGYCYSTGPYAGGLGGGAGGTGNGASATGIAGDANSGGGGGGGSDGQYSGAGGDGVVIIRYTNPVE